MKSTKSNRLLQTVYAASALFFAIVVLSSCGTTSKYKFSNSPAVPAAEGTVKVKQDGNNNYKIDLDVMRLAEPERLSPPKTAYVVWMETGNGSKNIGQLKTSSGFLSKTLKSSLSTVSPFKPISFFITAENDVNVQYPGEVMLRTGAN